MLVWARKEIGYTLEQAANAIGISVELLEKAERGEHQLTLKQLRGAADKYNFPFGYFYLSQPPHENTFKPVPDFRTDPDSQPAVHYRLNLEINKARERRKTFLDLAKKLNAQFKNSRLYRTTKNSELANM